MRVPCTRPSLLDVYLVLLLFGPDYGDHVYTIHDEHTYMYMYNVFQNTLMYYVDVRVIHLQVLQAWSVQSN